MASNSSLIKRLQSAINIKYDERLTYNTTQFYSESQKRMINMYSIKKTMNNRETGRHYYLKLFESASQLQLIFFLRDYWYKLEGTEIPEDNEVWNDIRQKIEVFSDWDSFREEVHRGGDNR